MRLSRAQIAKLDAQDKQVTAELAALVQASGSTLDELRGLSTVLVAELPVEVGDPRRFTIGGFAASTPQPRSPPRPRKDPASPSATATTPAATGA